ncbi:MAG TPA: hypothetical protein VGQ83_05780 [Polyangia bacterium]
MRGTRTASAIVLAVALALAGEAAAAPRSPRATAARPVVARSAAATSSMAACARALSRTNGPVWRRTPDGDLEQELPAACGGNYERRSRTGDPCRDGCFIADGTRELAVAARFREGNLLLVLVTSGRRFTPATWLRLPEGEIQLLDAGAADRVRRALGAVHGAAATQPRLGAGERVSFYVLGWRQDREGWHGELSAAVRVGVGLKLVPVAQASPREGGPPLRAASPSPPPRGVTRPTR